MVVDDDRADAHEWRGTLRVEYGRDGACTDAGTASRLWCGHGLYLQKTGWGIKGPGRNPGPSDFPLWVWGLCQATPSVQQRMLEQFAAADPQYRAVVEEALNQS